MTDKEKGELLITLLKAELARMEAAQRDLENKINECLRDLCELLGDEDKAPNPLEEAKERLSEDEQRKNNRWNYMRSILRTAKEINLVELDDNAYHCYGDAVLGYTEQEAVDFLLEDEHKDIRKEIQTTVFQYWKSNF